MNLKSKIICAVSLVLFSFVSEAQELVPDIGYAYPGGAQRGTTVDVIIGGQYIRGTKNILVKGGGITSEVIGINTFGSNVFNGKTNRVLQKMFEFVVRGRLAELNGTEPPGGTLESVIETGLEKLDKKDTKKANRALSHPLLQNLETLSIRELANVKDALTFPKSKLQINKQIAESLFVRLTIADDAKPGMRELRVQSIKGISNPINFQIGSLPEYNELEPNNKMAFQPVNSILKVKNGKVDLKEKPFKIPFVVNGQVKPGDVDRFRFKAHGGEKLVIKAEARSLIPYLADAVPGWFQATLTLYDSKGNKVAFADDFLFNPDPVMYFEIEKSGEYEIEIRDSIYRGRKDFVYRVSVAESPFITGIFPLGGQVGKKLEPELIGWNLDQSTIALDTSSEFDVVGKSSLTTQRGISNTITYGLDVLPSVFESEPNNDAAQAQSLQLPIVVDGRVVESGDQDIYSFEGKEGMGIAVEVFARKLNSPLDALITVSDENGDVIAMNDDYVLKDIHLHKDIVGLVTHHADSYLNVKLPKTGKYTVALVDTRRHGGIDHSYRLRISELMPNFALRSSQSFLNVRPGAIVPFEVHVMRMDGFEGPITVGLKNDEKGFSISGNRIPAGCNKIQMTLKTDKEVKPGNYIIELFGKAMCGKRVVKRNVVPADDTMQAFLFRHLVPAQEFVVNVAKKKSYAGIMSPVQKAPVHIFANSFANIKLEVGRFKAAEPEQSWFSKMSEAKKKKLSKKKLKALKKRQAFAAKRRQEAQKRINASKKKATANLADIQLELIKAPKGITLSSFELKADGGTIVLQASEEVESGTNTNLIVRAYKEIMPKTKDGKPTGRKKRQTVGYLPAIPLTIK